RGLQRPRVPARAGGGTHCRRRDRRPRPPLRSHAVSPRSICRRHGRRSERGVVVGMGIATGGEARDHWAARNDPQPASMPTLNSLLIPAAIVTALYAGGSDAPRHRAAPPANPVSANENRVAAGAMHGGILEVALEVRAGEWRPYGPGGPAVGILEFGETGKGLQTPGPLIRVRAGTHIHVRVRNTVEGTLVVHGLTAHHSAMPDTVVVPPGETRDIAFTADDEGTFFYWATTTGDGLSKRLF